MHIQLAPTFYSYKYVLKMLKALVQSENEVLTCQVLEWEDTSYIKM